jgi:spore coat polysaccharide biosynthesis protein SpsF
MRVVAIVQARMGSTRLRGKVLMDLGGRPMLEFLLARLRRAETPDAVWVATSTDRGDDPIADLCTRLAVPVFRGPEQDVLARYVLAAQASQADAIVRITADCPLTCPEIVDRCVGAFRHSRPPVDYVSNILRRTFPRGLDTEVVSYNALFRTLAESADPTAREHVTLHIFRNPAAFRHLSVEDEQNHASIRWTVDTIEDLTLIRAMVEELGPEAADAKYEQLLRLFLNNPEWADLNSRVAQKPL